MKLGEWWVRTFRNGSQAPSLAPAGPRKWLPVIDRDYCNGCGLCVKACTTRCLTLVWDFATLVRPEDCRSDGACVVCPDNLIRMDWVACPLPEDAPRVGRWQDAPLHGG